MNRDTKGHLLDENKVVKVLFDELAKGAYRVGVDRSEEFAAKRAKQIQKFKKDCEGKCKKQ